MFMSNLNQEAYRHSVNNLKDCLQGPMADIFLELFEQELKLYKRTKRMNLYLHPLRNQL